MTVYVKQVGGTHYQTAYEHWNLVITCNLPYLEGNATKYIFRWRKKGGVEDLRKALSYVDKIRSSPCMAQSRAARHLIGKIKTETELFFRVNHVPKEEREIISLICLWEHDYQLAEARNLLLGLICSQRLAPVPLTEENHYAERCNEGRQGVPVQAGEAEAGDRDRELNR